MTYPPIEDYALIGDCHTAALISREGSIDWCCLPRFDSGSAFGRLLDHRRGGCCSITPAADGPWDYSRAYLEDTLVLETKLSGPAGTARLIDCFLIRDPPTGPRRRQILRIVEGMSGAVEFRLRVAPRYDYGHVRPWIRRHQPQLQSAIGGDDAIVVWCEHELEEGRRRFAAEESVPRDGQ